MTQEDKELLLKDLCARLPYGVMADCGGEFAKIKYIEPSRSTVYISILGKTKWESIEVIAPYLRPMSSMNKEEKRDYQAFFNYDGVEYPEEYIDWLNKKMFDYRGLIEKGLAIEVTKDNNPYKE